jgi:hypothetical protein
VDRLDGPRPGRTWFTFYTGGTNTGHGVKQRIGLATSGDLYSWRRHPALPVLECDGRWYELLGSGRDEAWRDPWVFPDPACSDASQPGIANSYLAGADAALKNWAREGQARDRGERRVAATDRLGAVRDRLRLVRPAARGLRDSRGHGQLGHAHALEGWLSAGAIGQCVLAAFTVAALVAGVRRPRWRRAVAVTAWMIIPLGMAWFVLAGRLVAGS